METKRFIGNDMARIFVRVRSELGPDAVIVSTRSLLRDGAEPLIEVLASPAGSDAEMSVAMQRSIVQGLLNRVETSSRGLTIGDLEDLASRERSLAEELAPHASVPVSDPAPPAWLEGYVPAPEPPEEPAYYPATEPEPDHDELFRSPAFNSHEVAPSPMEFRARPRIRTRPQQEPAANDTHAAPRFAPIPPGVAGRLIAAGFSANAAHQVAENAPHVSDAERALGDLLASREANYPVDGRTAIITIQGAPGSGRTTAIMRMALDCVDAGRHAVLVAADIARTGGREQVHAYGDAIGVQVFDAFAPQDLVHAVTQSPKGSCIFVDVPAGAWSPPPIPGVQHFAYTALPSHWDGAVVAAHAGRFENSAGAVLTFTDLATSLIPALSLVVETGLGIAFLSSGRDVTTGIDVADPLTLASGVFTTSSRETTNGRLVATA